MILMRQVTMDHLETGPADQQQDAQDTREGSMASAEAAEVFKQGSLSLPYP